MYLRCNTRILLRRNVLRHYMQAGVAILFLPSAATGRSSRSSLARPVQMHAVSMYHIIRASTVPLLTVIPFECSTTHPLGNHTVILVSVSFSYAVLALATRWRCALRRRVWTRPIEIITCLPDTKSSHAYLSRDARQLPALAPLSLL